MIILKDIKYEETYKNLESLVSELEELGSLEDLRERYGDFWYEVIKKLINILEDLPEPDKEDLLLTTLQEIESAGLLKKAAAEAKILLAQEDLKYCYEPDEVNQVIIEKLEQLKHCLRVSDQHIVEEFLSKQGGFYRDAKCWTPF